MTEKALSKKLRSLIIIGVIFVLLLSSWIVLANTPLIDIIMGVEEPEPVKLVEGEVLGPNNRILMFEHVERSRIKSIKVKNPEGEYEFVNKNGSFGLEKYEGVYYDEQGMSSLIVTTGYTITQERVTDKATPEMLKEYGLDEPAAYWVLTTTEDKTYKVLVGDRILADGGYYGMLEGRENCVYILNSTVETNIFKPLEVYIEPLVCYGLTDQTYYLADNFSLTHCEGHDKDLFVAVKQSTKEEFVNPDAQAETKLIYPAGYKTNDSFFMSSVMARFMSMVGEEVVYMGTDDDRKAEYGLDIDKDPYYYIYFTLGSGKDMYEFVFFVSELQEDGYYYVISNLYNYDMVVKCSRETFSWLEADLINWVDDYPIMLNITNVDKITLEFDNKNYNFDLVHSVDSEGYAVLEVLGDDGFKLNNNDVHNFREFYKVLLSVQIMGSINDELNEEGIPAALTDEEIEAIVADKSKLMGKVTFHMANGTTNQYSFHRYSTRRAIFNYNGETNFYVLADWIEKLEGDAVKVMENIDVDSHWKN